MWGEKVDIIFSPYIQSFFISSYCKVNMAHLNYMILHRACLIREYNIIYSQGAIFNIISRAIL